MSKRSRLGASAFAAALGLSWVLSACGGSSPPRITGLSAPESIRRGVRTMGQVSVADDDGLFGLTITLTLSGPDLITKNVSVEESNDVTAADVPFELLVADAAPAGEYTLTVEAEDIDDQKSSPVSTPVVVQ